MSEPKTLREAIERIVDNIQNVRDARFKYDIAHRTFIECSNCGVDDSGWVRFCSLHTALGPVLTDQRRMPTNDEIDEALINALDLPDAASDHSEELKS